jgi:hypothetical protein
MYRQDNYVDQTYAKAVVKKHYHTISYLNETLQIKSNKKV